MLDLSANTWSRRSILSIGGLGLLGLNIQRVLAAAESRAAIKARAKSVIFLFQWGGPSHLDTFDMKPGAPAEIRGPLSPIATSVPGLQICHQLPAVAPQMHRMTIIRSMTHTMKNHNSAGYYALAGHAPASDDQRLRDSLDLWPAYGSIIDRFAPNSNGMPKFVP